MNQVNLLCETERCGNQANYFGIRGDQKTRSCESHVASLLSKGMQVISIKGYDFIKTLDDAREFETRSAKVDKGRGNLGVLELGFQTELQAALQVIETTKTHVIQAIESRFEEMKVAAKEGCVEAKSQLSRVQSELDLFLHSKQNALSPTAESVCGEMKAAPTLFKFMVKDVADCVSSLLSNSWEVCVTDLCSTLKFLENRSDDTILKAALEEAARFGRKGYTDALWYLDSLIQFNYSSLRFGTKALLEVLKFEKERSEQNSKWLQSSWDLRQRHSISDKATTEVGQKLANILCFQHGQFVEAERILRICYSQQDPQSEVSMSLCTDICGVYFASVQYQPLQSLGVWVLDTFGRMNLRAELYWTVLFYLAYSMKWENKIAEADQLLEQWRKRDFAGESKLAAMLRLLTSGIDTFFDLKYKDAVEWLEKALAIGKRHFPTSAFTALGFCHLARATERDEYYRHAQRIYEAAAPMSAHAAINLNFLGNSLLKRRLLDKSEECLRQAQAILDTTAPKSVAAGNNSLHMGQLCEARTDSQQAFQYYQKAASIYADNGALEKLDADEAIARLCSR